MTTTLLLIIQVFVVILLIAVILVQKTSSDSLAGLSGGGNSILSNKSTSNIFSKATIILSIIFVLNSLLIAKITNMNSSSKASIVDTLTEKSEQGKSQPNIKAPAVPEDRE
jgi:preprotein translocase subunit SecG